MRSSRLLAIPLVWLAVSHPALTRAQEPPCPCTLFGDTVPASADVGADSAVTLGVQFTPSADGYITGLRFYKSASNTGTHVGKLWSQDGLGLASVTFVNETASGWQEARFAVPVAVTAGTTYVASYRALNGHYAFTADFFTTEHRAGPLTAPAAATMPNGVFRYSDGFMPNSTYRAANYWVDVTFDTLTSSAPRVIGVQPAAGATNAAAPVTATFNLDMDPSTLVFTLKRPDDTPVAGTVNYDASSKAARFTPTASLVGLTTYTASVTGRSTTGAALASPHIWSFTTGAVGFRDTTVMTGLQGPTTIRFAPGGLLFIAEKSGLIKVFESFNDTTPVIFADLRTEVHNFWDRGLLGLALHPNFPQQPYVYVAYSRDAQIGGVAPLYGRPGESWDSCPSLDVLSEGCTISARVSRLTAVAVPGGYQMSGAEQVLIDGWGQQYPSHSIGSLEFGADGALYVTGGEGASYSFVDYGHRGNPPNPLGDPPTPAGEAPTPPYAEGGALRSQSRLRAGGGPVLLNGMVLRVDPNTGAGLPDNPLAASTDVNARRVIAEGLRNPYRFTIKPGTNDVWIGDVGWNDVEEINRVPGPAQRVLNFGWPCYEGAAPQAGYQATQLAICQSLYATAGTVEPPAFQYAHWDKVVAGEACDVGSSAIAGLAFYQGGAYPAEYNGALFFSDYARRCVWAAFPDPSGQIDFSRRVTVLSNAATPVDLRVGPGGDLFYVDLGFGTIHRIEYLSQTEQQTVRAALTATPSAGLAPLTVAFDGSQSSGAGLTYAWDFGDGTAPVTGGAQISHTYPLGGFIARLTVTDSAGASAVATTPVSSTAAPPIPVIDAPLPSLRFAVGDAITFSGHATDAAGAPLAPSQLSWSLAMNHCSDSTNCHSHALQDFVGVASGSFAAPDHEYPCYMILMLTARDAQGVSASTSVRIDPRTVDLTFATQPAGLSLVVGSSTATAPVTRTRIVGSLSSIAAPASQTVSGVEYRFVSWSDGGAQTHDITAPSQNTTYTGTYAAQQAAALTLFGTATPSTIDAGADSAVELGVKFRADVSGSVAGVRFYKSAANTGAHVGSLWSVSGTRLAFVTFTGETASGWQEARFANPVPITAGTVYVVSYHATGGHYSHNANFFAAQHDAGVLHAPAQANGVFKYGPAGSFPTSSYGAANYWVDVLFTSTPDTTPPTITARSPAPGAVDVQQSSGVSVTFSEPMQPECVNSVSLFDASGATVPGVASYDAATQTIAFAPASPLAASATYTVRVAGSPSSTAPRDTAGNAMQADMTWSFHTAAVAAAPSAYSLFPSSLQPAVVDAGADAAVELGMRFKAASHGVVLGVRFYKSAANTGPHVGSLWTTGGIRLAQVTFAGETASGWQEGRFASPVAITAGTTYVVSYHMTGGHYSVTSGFFNSRYENGPLSAPATSQEPNGLFTYGPAAGAFPASTYNAANYWVDVLYAADAADTVAPTVTASVPAAGATGVAHDGPITATFSESMSAASVTSASFTVRDSNGAVDGTVVYDAAAKTARFTPAASLTANTTYTMRILGGSSASPVSDLAGNAMAADFESNFTTAAPVPHSDGCPCSLFSASLVPAVVDAGADSSVELGVKFSADEAGFIHGIRFYKSAANVGPHEVSLWTGTGTLLARVTSAGETASGWQEVMFSTPVAVTPGTVYVASYHVNGGHYSYTNGYFNVPRDAAPLHAPAGSNGVFAYGSSSAFPGSSYNSTNYWVDVVFVRQ
jgi:glucose/arabinose dehydrogenase